MLALQAYEDACCSGCGGFLADTTAEEAEEAYKVPPPTRCHRCTVLGQKTEEYKEARQAQALLYRVERR